MRICFKLYGKYILTKQSTYYPSFIKFLEEPKIPDDSKLKDFVVINGRRINRKKSLTLPNQRTI